MSDRERRHEDKKLTRRGFIGATGAAVAGGVIAGCGGGAPAEPTTPTAPAPDAGPPAAESAAPEGHVRRHRTLGRTGFEVSDISMGCGRIADAGVVRYAYDHGVNLFDVAESYGNGDSERKIGEAMPHMDRDKIFIVTKLKINPEDTEQTIRDRAGRCLERMRTDHVDALYMHAVTDTAQVTHAGFHAALAKLKADGKVRHAGISSHGPREPGQSSMSEVLLAAVEDGRFDVMLLVHNFMKAEEGEQVLAACAEKNVGTTGMKTYAGQLEVEMFDPESPSEDHARSLKILQGRGMTPDEAVAYMQKRVDAHNAELAEHKGAVDAFVAAHGVQNQLDLDRASIQWVLANEKMHTVCVALPDFDRAAQILPISGTPLSAAGLRMLGAYAAAHGSRYCRHGCVACQASCPHGVPVSTVMRYSYYFNHHHREKYAMERYASLEAGGAARCLDCDAPCQGGCPHGVPVQLSMIRAHGLLTLA